MRQPSCLVAGGKRLVVCQVVQVQEDIHTRNVCHLHIKRAWYLFGQARILGYVFGKEKIVQTKLDIFVLRGIEKNKLYVLGDRILVISLSRNGETLIGKPDVQSSFEITCNKREKDRLFICFAHTQLEWGKQIGSANKHVYVQDLFFHSDPTFRLGHPWPTISSRQNSYHSTLPHLCFTPRLHHIPRRNKPLHPPTPLLDLLVVVCRTTWQSSEQATGYLEGGVSLCRTNHP